MRGCPCLVMLCLALACVPSSPDEDLSGGIGLDGGSDESSAAASDGGATTSGSGASVSAGEGGGDSTSTPSDGPADDADDAASSDDAADTEGTSGGTTAGGDTRGSDGGESSTGEELDGVLDIGIIAHDDCTFTVTPSSITVPEGTEFTVNWISEPSSDIEFDVAKIDPFNQVPIIIGLEPGNSYHDEVRVWCGELFTGTFDFRLTSCYDPTYIPVDCGG